MDNFSLVYFLAAVCAFCGTPWLSRRSWKLSLPILFLLSLAVHFRSSVYFYYDEWHVLQRYAELGLPGVIYTHNEHFLPLFFTFYYFEALLFGEHYLCYTVLSIFIHAANTLLLMKLLQKLLPTHEAAGRLASTIVGLLFLANSLHCEALHWAFEQSLLLSQFCSLLAFILAIDALRTSNKLKMAASLVLLGMAPLFFGNGFTSFLHLGLLAIFILCFDADSFWSTAKARFKDTCILLGLGVLVALIPAWLYLSFREGSGHTLDDAKPFENLDVVWDYIYAGSQFGSIFRGLGLFHSLELTAASGAELDFAYKGFLCSLGILAGICLAEDRKRLIPLWCMGQLVLLSSFMLPAFGRWQYGIMQGLSLRYHYMGLIGLAIMIYPLLVYLCSQQGKIRLGLFVVGGVICSLVLSTHLKLGAEFRYFTKHGARHKKFADDLSEWRSKINALGQNIPYEGTGTPHEGKHPRLPKTITPGRHPDDIYRVLLWLRS